MRQVGTKEAQFAANAAGGDEGGTVRSECGRWGWRRHSSQQMQQVGMEEAQFAANAAGGDGHRFRASQEESVSKR